MTPLIAIAGLLLLVFLHELGHFVVALAVGMRPRKFYVGFPPPLVRRRHRGVEYGIGLIPLGGYVKIPGMFRPAAADLGRWFGRAVEDAPELHRPVDEAAAALDRSDFRAAREALDGVESAAAGAELSALTRREVDRGLTELRDALAPDAYWRQRAWRRVAVIFAGPAMNVVVAIVLFAGVFMVGTGDYRLGFALRANGTEATRVVDSVLSGWPAQHAGLRAGDRIVAIDGRAVTPDAIPTRIRASDGTPLRLTVVRDGATLALPAASARKDAGESPPRAFWSSLKVTGDVTKQIGASLANLVHAQGRKQISSPVGIVRGSEQAIHQGARDYLSVLGLISLSLALLNLLPLLPLDGGHIAFSIIEGIRGRAVARAVYERASAIGIALVVLLFFIGLSNDLGGGAGG